MGFWDQHLNLTQHELQNASIQNLATDPSTPVKGQVYLNTTTNKIRVYNGTTWDELGTGTGNVTQASNSGSSGRLKVSGGADRSIQDYSGGVGLVKSDASGVVSPAVEGTDYVTGTSTNTFTNKTFDANGTGNTISNIETADLASGVLNTSGTLAGATNAQVPSALAVKTVTDALATSISNVVASADALVFKGGIDCSTNPNYPAADAGWVYKVTVAGKIGGASGINVEVGDTLTCTVDATASGTQAAVGANWLITQTNLESATTTVGGYVTLATQAEANAQSVSNKAVTPASLADYPISQSVLFGNAVLTTFTIAHGRGTSNIVVSVYDAGTGEQRYPNVIVDSTNVTISGYLSAPAANSMRAVIIG